MSDPRPDPDPDPDPGIGSGRAVEDAVAALSASLLPLDEAVAGLVRGPGLIAWWAPPEVLPAVAGTPHPDDDVCLLDVGAGTMLRNRVTRQDLYRTGVSALRRTLAGLLLDELGLAPTWAAEVILPRADEERLTAWMREHLRLSWTAREDRRTVLAPVIAAMDPALTLDRDPEPDLARRAHDRFITAAGEKTERVVGVPFQRP